MGSIGGWGRIKMASASTLSANKPSKDLILVHTVQLKPMIKHISLEEWYLISDVRVHSEKSRLIMMIIIIIVKNHKKKRFLVVARTDFHHEIEARKVMIDIKFDVLCSMVPLYGRHRNENMTRDKQRENKRWLTNGN